MIKKIFLFVACVMSVFSCANIVKPSGGPKDTQGPKLIGSVPHTGARNFMGKEVVFYFDEFLKPSNYSKEVFISPIQKTKPEVIVYNKTLKVKFKEPLMENTTYVITLGKEIKDMNEQNKMEESYVYAFSTGDVLDTLSFGGSVVGAWGNLPEQEMTVLLYKESSVVGDSILGVQPVYAVETDNNGKFQFRYLQNGRYKVYAVKDSDNDFTYSQTREMLALTADPLIDLADTALRAKSIDFVSFVQDNEGPKVKSVRWSNDQVIHVEFAEEIQDTVGNLSLEVYVQDSNGSNKQKINQFRYRNEDGKHLYLVSPVLRTHRMDVSFRNVMDSLGQAIDTVVVLPKDALLKEEKNKFFEAPYFIYKNAEVRLPALYPLPPYIDTSQCYIQDSAGRKLNAMPISSGLDIYFQLVNAPDPNNKYEIVIQPSLEFVGSFSVDSTLKIPFAFPDVLKYGSVSGVIVGDSSKPGMKYVAIITGPPGPTVSKKEKPKNWSMRISGPGPFSIPFLPEGNYAVMMIEDLDGNGFLTPGSLSPYRLPEKMITGIPQFEIKGNWELKNYKIQAVNPRTEGKGKVGETEGDEMIDKESADPQIRKGKAK